MDLDKLQSRLGVTVDPKLLKLALTHSSYSYENGGENNERLEFLGDSILGYVVTSHLFSQLPDLNEGELTKIKNGVVSAQALASVSQRLDIGKYLFLGKGEEQTLGRKKPNLLADAFEAILGAVYLSAGMDEAKKVIQQFIFPLLDDPDAIREASDPKTTLNEKLLARGEQSIFYEIAFEGPDHQRVFFAKAFSGERLLGKGKGSTRRSAESDAAVDALRNLDNA
jgi:ribonuclease III, bacterial